jgi:hypothetical protein
MLIGNQVKPRKKQFLIFFLGKTHFREATLWLPVWIILSISAKISDSIKKIWIIWGT